MSTEGRAGPRLTCAHFGSSRSSPAATARGLGSACEAPGHGRGRLLRRAAEGPGWAASTCTTRPRLERCRSQSAAVKPRPPRRPRSPQPRGLPGLVVPSVASAGSSPEILILGIVWVEEGVWGWGAVRGEVGKAGDGGDAVPRHNRGGR